MKTKLYLFLGYLLVIMKTATSLVMADQSGDFGFTIDGSSVTITNYTGAGGTIAVPDSINDVPVASIGNKAFYQAYSLTNITLPDSVTNIGNSAFQSCAYLTNVIMSANLISIGNLSFSGCSKLSGLMIPDKVVVIGWSAFSGCDGLAYIIIPNGITNIDNSTFQNCRYLTNVVIGANVANIGRYAFGGCFKLANIIFPPSVRNIGSSAFDSCGLTNITIPDSVTNISGAFAYCSLTSVTIGNGVKSIGSSTFKNCEHLTSVTLGASVTNIMASAFDFCYGLKSITIPKSVIAIDANAFNYCTNLNSLYFEGNYYSSFGSILHLQNATLYYLPGALGWPFVTLSANKKALWNPQVKTNDDSFGVRTNRFGFNIVGTSNLVIVVEACTNFSNPVWSPVSTNILNTFVGTNGISYFSDPEWTNRHDSFYRLRSP